MSPGQVGIAEICVRQVREAQIGIGEMGKLQDRANEYCVAKIRTGQISRAQVSKAQIGESKIGPG